LAVLRERMEARGQDSAAEIAHRLRTAEGELREADKFDFQIQSQSRDEDFAALQRIWHDVQARAAR
jgi:guanylate kinase